jgi:GNAT superfamily N-acetyltransferase
MGEIPEPGAFSLRAAAPADAEALAGGMGEALAGYGAFAPPGWTAPSLRAEAVHLRGLLADPQVWCLLAEGPAGAIAGQVTVLPASRAAHPVPDPALGHLRNLFVRPDHWGTGLARALHAAALEAARERGFAALRLFTPAGQARARRFYEREGWVAAGAPFDDPAPGLPLVEYRRALGR